MNDFYSIFLSAICLACLSAICKYMPLTSITFTSRRYLRSCTGIINQPSNWYYKNNFNLKTNSLNINVQCSNRKIKYKQQIGLKGIPGLCWGQPGPQGIASLPIYCAIFKIRTHKWVLLHITETLNIFDWPCVNYPTPGHNNIIVCGARVCAPNLIGRTCVLKIILREVIC